MQENRAKLKKPGMSVSDVAKAAGVEWGKASFDRTLKLLLTKTICSWLTRACGRRRPKMTRSDTRENWLLTRVVAKHQSLIHDKQHGAGATASNINEQCNYSLQRLVSIVFAALFLLHLSLFYFFSYSSSLLCLFVAIPRTCR